ncbi:MAG: glycoside hydrolase family 99-like domain-containing protein [Oscillospiraceae bacterium]
MKNTKKVFAEYHNPRYTRDKYDGLGNWKDVNESKNSKAEIKRYNYNADLIDENGHHDIASVNYPIIGMQSQNDPDYIEYQILLAKIAHIDGFMTDFRHIDDAVGVEQVEILKNVAEKYNFEIGVDWCDAQIFYSLLKVHNELDTRKKQIEYCKKIFEYLLTKIYDEKTGANIDGHPVILLFGDGFTFEEYKYLKNNAKNIKEPKNEPWYFRRTMMDCKYNGKDVEYKFAENHDYFKSENRSEFAGPFGWIPFRLRNAVQDGFKFWDVYATQEDCIKYLHTLLEHVRENQNKYKAFISVVTPGMDHRGCAAWGRDISLIQRGNGEIYRAMWEFNVKNSTDLAGVFIAGWNDYNEGHEIEPTIQNGYRELEITHEYAKKLKNISDNEEEEFKEDYLKLPQKLFEIRKKTEELKNIGVEVRDLKFKNDEMAIKISNGEYEKAENLATEILKIISQMELKILNDTISLKNMEVLKPKTIRNIVREAKVEANNDSFGKEAWRAIDGEKMRSFWQTNSEISVIEFSFEKPRHINEVVIETGLVDRSDTPNWPMIPKNIGIYYADNGIWNEISYKTDNTMQDMSFKCDIKTDKIRVSSNDNTGIIIRNIDICSDEGNDNKEVLECYDGLYMKVCESDSKKLRENYFEGFLEFDYFDDGYGTFEVHASSNKFGTVCQVTKDDTKTWKHAKVLLYKCNMAFDHSLKGASDFLFVGDVKINNVEANFNIKLLKREE